MVIILIGSECLFSLPYCVSCWAGPLVGWCWCFLRLKFGSLSDLLKPQDYHHEIWWWLHELLSQRLNSQQAAIPSPKNLSFIIANKWSILRVCIKWMRGRRRVREMRKRLDHDSQTGSCSSLGLLSPSSSSYSSRKERNVFTFRFCSYIIPIQTVRFLQLISNR